MPDFKKMLRDLADMYEREEKGEESKQLQERIDALEAKIANADPTPAELNEAHEDITDEEWDLIREHRAGATPKREEKPTGEEQPEPKQKKTRPGRKKGSGYMWTVDDKGRVQKTDIAHIYSGDDEPDEVELPDDEEEQAA